MKKALIFGITGQDGSYLAEYLLSLGYEVHGAVRRASSFNTSRIDHLYQDPHSAEVRLFLHFADLSDTSRLFSLLSAVRPDEVYNLAAQSHVKVSFDEPELTGDVTALGCLRLLDAIRLVSPESKFLQASSSEMFGSTPPPQSELSQFSPQSPYAVAKLYSYWTTRNYRDSYGLHASNAIMFNHESPRRGETFVTRKITRAAARISAGTGEKLYLGNLDSRRDFGYAPEYVRGLWLMLQQDRPEDYVFATGVSVSILDFLDTVFSMAGLEWQDHVVIDPRYYRPSEVNHLQGDASKALEFLNWKPKVKVDRLAEIMLNHDLRVEKALSARVVDNPVFQ